MELSSVYYITHVLIRTLAGLCSLIQKEAYNESMATTRQVVKHKLRARDTPATV